VDKRVWQPMRAKWDDVKIPNLNLKLQRGSPAFTRFSPHVIVQIKSEINMNDPRGINRGFLSFNKSPPKIYITAEDDDFDETTIQHWQDEGMVPSNSLRVSK
jgi:hypothetical protein